MERGLGKGINAFFPELEDEKESESVLQISVKECRPNPYQPRKTFQADAIEELKESIMEFGILQPLIVRDSIKGFEIVAGERRFRAAKEAGLDTIPVIVKNLTDQKMMELALLENLQREDLTPIEEAQAYANLMKEFNITQEELAKRLGKSRPHIANLTRLLSLPTTISALINNGELSMGHGRAILGLKDKNKLQPLIDKIRKDNLNVRQVEQLVNHLNEKKVEQKKQPNKKDLFITEREGLLRDHLGTGVKIHKGKRKGKIEIEFFSDDDLDRILELFQ
ncbi:MULTISPECIES: ParB/RepB/Spo0J family partition protein [Paraliobacillus]|uniref:ParB/RepB/Spo0J family partition protein n=1 Tax=Paraliobacillus TaxID=200903 RepID=UPI000DD4EA46|nr:MULTISPECIES: ParB/RepB/Spo0J family partition protein [Paraliobacillus]